MVEPRISSNFFSSRFRDVNQFSLAPWECFKKICLKKKKNKIKGEFFYFSKSNWRDIERAKVKIDSLTVVIFVLSDRLVGWLGGYIVSRTTLAEYLVTVRRKTREKKKKTECCAAFAIRPWHQRPFSLFNSSFIRHVARRGAKTVISSSSSLINSEFCTTEKNN